jgi:hypothetical protein
MQDIQAAIMVFLFAILLVGGGIYSLININKKSKDVNYLYGFPNELLVCPHCQSQGKVRSKIGKYNSGLSGGKILLALFTLGITLIFTGISKFDTVTFFHCDNCNTDWRTN